MDIDDVKPRMDKTLEFFRQEMATLRTDRAAPSILENVVCEVYGGSQKLKLVELGTITSPDPKTITVQPWDASIIGEIRQSITKANIGLTPIIDGEIIRIDVPPLSAERRREFLKLLSKLLENVRTSIRTIRRDKMLEIRKAYEEKEVSEDEKFRAEQDLQKITDEYMEKIEEMEKKKEEELTKI
jgi:ribosome recycling factor